MEPISNNPLTELSPAKRSRRRHSPAFKAKVLTACAQPGASIAAVAQRYQLNANLIRKWRQAANVQGSHASNESVDFIPLPVADSVDAGSDLRVTITLGRLTIHWPISHINESPRVCRRVYFLRG
jgi:transposase